ncbi:MFS general substrate transporter [Sistotremastrum niveocremeum HHB9708]|uniref:MFS general substrate transporter n=1 Tax=Sistotremastrum niveocremeum HHB9708 TaxID=1314777 RepID=A0A164QP40_9AGAM|nr:MFS general substrate transporter [Sistotremastrum niveocremeum HHB9708]
MPSVSDEPPSETTPLVSSSSLSDDAKYERFSFRRKQTILATVSCCRLLTFFTSSSFTPTIPQIARDLKTSGSIINLSVGVFVFTAAVGSLFWARYSGYYGRQPIYVASLPIYCLGSIGVAACRNVPELLIFRALQAFGSCAFQSVGAGTIADIFKLEERGRAMGVYNCLALIGPSIAPFIGGLVAERASWRAMQAGIGFVGLVALVLVIIFLPETMHPGTRGIDKAEAEFIKNGKSRKILVLLNPFRALALMRSPVLFLSTMAATATLITDHVVLLPLAYTIGERYGVGNQALVGALFLPSGVGNMIGTTISGWLSDNSIKKWRALRHGEWLPEDRLRATWHGALFLVPLSTLGMGLAIHFIDGSPGIWINMLLLLTHGIGITMVLGPCATYNVDIMYNRSAEVVAANYAIRNGLVSTVILGVLPAIETIGVLWTNGIAAILGWIGFGLIVVCIRYGARMRAWSSIQHTDGSR